MNSGLIRHVFVFLGTFLAGALIVLAIRAAAFDPHRAPHAPDDRSPKATAAASAADPHAAHASAAAPVADGKPVNTVCAICGMDVDPRLPTLEYQGKKIGFGCRMCPPKFTANPDKYGPYYLRNEVIEK